MSSARRRCAVVITLATVLPLACGDDDNGQPHVPQDLSIVLQRGLCFGSCPIYSLEVDESGSVRYEGDRFVKVGGVHHDSVSDT